MLARIFQPAKTAMQSGKARNAAWRLEFEAEAARRIDPLMGWTSGSDTRANQVQLDFDSKEEAVAYAERNGVPYQLAESPPPTPTPKAYSDNFAWRRRFPWTH
jgi:hypothetical protein